MRFRRQFLRNVTNLVTLRAVQQCNGTGQCRLTATRAIQGVGQLPLVCWDGGFESPPGNMDICLL
jgi:hypothetical protein